MARTHAQPTPSLSQSLAAHRRECVACGGPLWSAYWQERSILTLSGWLRLSLQIRRCTRYGCALFGRPYPPEEEGGYALPHGEIGLDVIASVGAQRFGEHRSVPEIHRALEARQLRVCERSVTNLIQRYEELVSLHVLDRPRLTERLLARGRAVLAIDGLQPDVGHEVLWVIRECLSGEVLLARPLLSATEADLAALFREVVQVLPVPIVGVISDGQQSLRKAVASALPGVPHQLCQFHYLREAGHFIFEADRHAKKELKKQVRGVRPIERQLEGRTDAEAVATRAYCLAVRHWMRRACVWSIGWQPFRPPSTGWPKKGASARPPARPRSDRSRSGQHRRPVAGDPHRLWLAASGRTPVEQLLRAEGAGAASSLPTPVGEHASGCPERRTARVSGASLPEGDRQLLARAVRVLRAT